MGNDWAAVVEECGGPATLVPEVHEAVAAVARECGLDPFILYTHASPLFMALFVTRGGVSAIKKSTKVYPLDRLVLDRKGLRTAVYVEDLLAYTVSEALFGSFPAAPPTEEDSTEVSGEEDPQCDTQATDEAPEEE